MKRPGLASIALALLSCIPPPARGAAEGISEVMERIRQSRRKTDFRAEARLTHVDGGGQRKNYRLTLKGKCFGPAVKVLFEVTEPATSRFRLLAEYPLTGSAGASLKRLLDGKAETLPPERRGDAFLNSCFLVEDLLENHFSWPEQTLLRTEKYGSRLCYVIRSEAGSGDRDPYRTVTSWVDRESLVPVYIEKIARKAGAAREFRFSGIRESKGFWGARQVEARVKGEQARSFLVLTRANAAAKLTDKDFAAGASGKGPGKP